MKVSTLLIQNLMAIMMALCVTQSRCWKTWAHGKITNKWLMISIWWKASKRIKNLLKTTTKKIRKSSYRSVQTNTGWSSTRLHRFKLWQCHRHSANNHIDLNSCATCWAPTVGSANRPEAHLLLRGRYSPAFAWSRWRDIPESNPVLA